MSRTKTCPTCQKELPILAVRCKYCGFKLSSRADRNNKSANKNTRPLETAPPKKGKMPKTTLPPSSPNKATLKQNQKKTMMGFAAPSEKKPTPLVSKTTAPRPKVPGKSVSPPPLPKKATKKVDLAKPTTVANQTPIPVSDHSAENHDWIPEVEDMSQIILLNTENTGNTEQVKKPHSKQNTPLGAALHRILSRFLTIFRSGTDRIKGALPSKIEWISLQFQKILPLLKPLRNPILPQRVHPSIDKLPLPSLAHQVLKKMQIMHVGIGFVGIILLVVIICVSTGGDEKPSLHEKPQQDLIGDAATTPNEASSNTPQNGKTTTPKKPQKLEPVPPVKFEKPKAVPTPDSSCFALGSYPTFLWKKHIQKMLSQQGKSGICELFGLSRNGFKSTFDGFSINGSGGLDGLDNSQILQVFFKGDPLRKSPKMELIFYDNKLFRIVLDYKTLAKTDFNEKILEDLLELAADKNKDHMGRNVTALEDGELLVKFVEDTRNKKTSRMLIFSSKSITAGLRKELNNLKTAEKILFAGNKLFTAKNYRGAMKKFRDAGHKCPYYGIAFINLAKTAIRIEDFKGVSENAFQALERSRDTRIQADARGLRALAALYNGDKSTALNQYKKAHLLDRENSYFAEAIQEIKTGTYQTARVAQTAARMSCLGKLKATSKGILARGNYLNTEVFFAALRTAKKDSKFNKLQKQFTQTECR